MLSAGQSLLSFEIIAPLGAGGMGEVFRARDTLLHRDVALKVLSESTIGDSARRRFAREAQTLATVNHPHVAQIYGYHEDKDYCFLSLEFVDGEDLVDRIRTTALPLDEALKIASHVAEGLEAAHRAGIVHRDLKPANIRITADGSAKILDFGLAKLAAASADEKVTNGLDQTVELPITQHGTIVGTASYMSPEQARGQATDHRTDIWAFGCVLYECLTGHRAFEGASAADVIAAVLGVGPNWARLPARTPDVVASVLRKCLTKNVDARLGNIRDARLVLSQITLSDVAASRTHRGETAVISLPLVQAREACEAREWQSAFDLLAEADQRRQLEPEGLELLAECSRWLGRNEQIFDPLERAHSEYVAQGGGGGAVRTALALSHANNDAGRAALAAVWWERASDLISDLPEGPEHAWHAWFQNRSCMEVGDLEGIERHASRALELARRYGERDVEALALVDLSHVATTRGDGQATLDLIHRAISMALGGEINIFATGMVFCNAIWACRCRGEWNQAEQWTESATRWVTRQQVQYFPGMCRVHRSEVLRVRGDLAGAESECEAATRQVSQALPAFAVFPWSELGEVRRRRGNFSGAMEAFQHAISLGWDPQPGLALLLMQQGDVASAHRSIERTCSEPGPMMVREDRVNLLAARATIAVANNELETAEAAVAELEDLAARNDTTWERAAAAHASGLLSLTLGHASDAVDQLIKAKRWWVELNTPYELAKTRVLLSRALQAEGDRTQAKLELAAAHEGFERIGAEFDREETQTWLDVRSTW